MVLPIVKLVTLLIRQSSRPVVHRLTVSATRHPKFRSVIVLIAQKYHSMDFTSQRKLLGFGKPTPVEPLSTDEAMNLGTKLLGEALVYGVSASFLLYEYNRSLKNERIKAEKRKCEIEKLQKELHEHGLITEDLKGQMFKLQVKNWILENSLSSLKSR
ncbi:putative OPA3-like protein CG43998 [Mytilus californianus]|uniref:putative OPA3-like protein CG43998 n=1 Tax=Mytilus californianus TaxID=6549 RepID=UPI002245DE99|nr:putative OPA3-like protein CG43998 [Mytilus californianus]